MKWLEKPAAVLLRRVLAPALAKVLIVLLVGVLAGLGVANISPEVAAACFGL